MTATLGSFPVFRAFDADGAPLVGGLLYSYAAGTTTPLATYVDQAGVTTNANPVVLDSTGSANVWFGSSAYKLVLKTATGSTLWTVDNYQPESAAATLQANLASTASAALGDALVGVKKLGTSSVATTQHLVNETIYRLADFGATGSGSDDILKIQAAIDAVYAAGGGLLLAERGKTYVCTTGPIIKDKVVLDLQGSTLSLTLSGSSDYGVRLRNYAGIQNGTVAVTSSGSPGAQGGIHAPIHIGSMYGSQGTVASPLPDDSVTGFTIRNMTLSTTATGKVAIAGLGDLSNGIIENITVPSSSVMSGIHFDWGALGSVDSNDIPGTRTLFNAGTALTTHPRNIIIRNIRFGTMSYATFYGVRLSGVHNITVENVEIDSSAYCGFYHTAGDCGYEFAPAALKPSAHKGIKVRGFSVKAANNGWGAFVDCFADNIAAAVSGSGYSPLLAPICDFDLILEQFHTVGSGGGSAVPGFRIQASKGLTIKNSDASLHLNGILVDTGSDRVTVDGGHYYSNRSHGILVHHASDLPEDFKAIRVVCELNATDSGSGTGAGIKTDYATRPWIENCILGGETSDASQDYGIQMTSGTTGAIVLGNHCRSTQAAGYGYAMGTSNTYDILWLFANNSTGAGVATNYAGVNILPTVRKLTPGGTLYSSDYIAEAASLSAGITPSAGTWRIGDRIWYASPTFAGYSGTVCTAAGSPGTWHAFGALV